MSGKRSNKQFWSDQRGAVAATYALALIPLIAIAGLGFDYARVMGMDTELQNAADQAALAGATQLNQTSDSMTRAINAATGNLVTNSTFLSNDGAGGTIAITDTATQIVFYANKADAEAGTGGFTDTSRFAEARFIEVTVDTRDARYAFTPVVGALVGSLNAGAVAGVGSAVCRIPPLMICNPDEPTSGDKDAPFLGDNYKGRGLLVVQGGNNAWAPGDFGYLDLGNGANGVREGLGWPVPGGGCLAVDDADKIGVDTEPGVIADAPDSLNTRFDIYDNVACPAGDDCPAARNNRKDVVRPANATPSTGNSCKYGNQGWREPAVPYQPPDLTPLDPLTDTMPTTMGHPRDICHAVGENNAAYCNSPFGDGVWDIAAYVYTHFRRTDGSNTRWSMTDFATNTGLDATASRYDVYKWEKDNRNTLVDGLTVLETFPKNATGSTNINPGQPVCSNNAYGYAPTTIIDRRVMSIAVVNCVGNGVRGARDNVPVETWVDVFLVQPSLNRGTGPSKRTTREEIYVEIMGESKINGTGTNGGLVVRRDVPYLVR
ncbi:pilus assembly protein [Altererythrobacter arenosus]|uniref:Pilus assembly protein n=1 Tax=Altererythrobacter arenosus TaxID=3032592 RepID=A0ABY8FNN8_9SPHN|nr:TadE/TadG family type IV pilus assembly protein [Altererythrobacter sp. CAU 1644]WFL76628.1 pilus assembly protein [Altererythrobacter sp. CAU 1644]